MDTQQSRRKFIKNVSAGMAVPFILPSGLWSATPGPNEKLSMAFIGTGKMGRGLLNGFIGHKDVQVVAVCDVDTTRREAAKKKVDEYYGNTDCAAYNNFLKIIERKDIDAVVIATPDHWHANITIAALNAGKDVYCEKPLTHNIHESVEVIDAVERTGGVLQTGSMQRSMTEFRKACELVRNGHIGKLQEVICSFRGPGIPYNLKEEPMEPGLDWDMWVGPAPMCAYNSILSPRGVHDHFPMWRSFREFGGGMVLDLGAHHLDIAQWGLGMDESGPVEVRPPAQQGDEDGATLIYANGVPVIHRQKGSVAVLFKGSDGEVEVGRGKIRYVQQGKEICRYMHKKDKSINLAFRYIDQHLGENPKVKLYNSRNHGRDFLDAMKARTKPVAHEGIGGRSAVCCHLMNQAYYNHAAFKWDPKNFRFADGTGDPSWLTRNYRSPWTV